MLRIDLPYNRTILELKLKIGKGYETTGILIIVPYWN